MSREAIRRFLFAERPLSWVVAELDDLWADPRLVLSQEEIVIGPANVLRCAVVIMALAMSVPFAFTDLKPGWLLWFCVGTCIGGLLVLMLYIVNSVRLVLDEGRRLGASAQRAAPSETAEQEPAPAASSAVLKNGWLTLHFTQLHFPNLCCDCGEPARYRSKVKVFQPFAMLWMVLSLFRYIPGHATVSLPWCQECHQQSQPVSRLLVWGGMVFGFLLGAMAGLAIAYRDDAAVKVVLSLIFGVIGLILGLICGREIFDRFVSTFPRMTYSSLNKTVSFRFADPDYAKKVRAAVEAGSRN